MQSQHSLHSNTTATAARLHHIAEMLIAWGRLCHGGHCHTDHGDFVIKGRLRHGVGDICMAGDTL